VAPHPSCPRRRGHSGAVELRRNDPEEAAMTVTIYHNPRCAKSRATLALLEARGLRPTVVEYLKTPPSAAQLKRVLKLLGISARALLRTKEAEYKAAGLDNQKLSEEKIVAAMVKHPILIERPIVVAGAKAALGRPPEKVLEIL
jgi:arsenate reductase (glutaredoxin)